MPEVFAVVIFIFIFIPLIVFLYFMFEGLRKDKINEKVHSIGGTVISIERRNFFTGLGPFMVVGRGRSVYMFEYSVNNKRKEGWVRFGGLFGPDWRL